jgi:hypothetical protein
MNPSNAADATKQYGEDIEAVWNLFTDSPVKPPTPARPTKYPNNGEPLRTELSLRLPLLSRRDRREIELGARRLVKKQMRKVKHG